jgi:hypothetical protein
MAIDRILFAAHEGDSEALLDAILYPLNALFEDVEPIYFFEIDDLNILARIHDDS